MRKLFLVIALLIVILSLTMPALALDGYGYYYSVSLKNDGASQISGRFLIPTNAKALVDGYYIQDDAEDVAITYGGAEEALVALGLDEVGSVNWRTEYVTLDPGQTKSKTIWLGDPDATRDQVWIADDGDTVTISEDSSFDITDDLTITADVHLDELPSSEKTIIKKTGSYELAVDGTNFIFRVYGETTATEILRPNGNLGSLYLDYTGASGYAAVDEDPHDATTTFVTETSYGSNFTDRYSLTDSALTTEEIDHVTVTGVSYSAGPGAYGQYRSGLYLNSTDNYATWTGYQAPYGTWQTNTFTVSRPGGGTWSASDMDSLGQIVNINYVYSVCYVTQLYVTVYYITADSGHEVTIPATTDTWTSIEAHYDTSDSGAELRMRLDGGTWQTASYASGIIESDSGLTLLDFDGNCDSLGVNDNGTDVLNLEFEPDEISSTTITDLSTSGNDVTYSLAANPGDLTITYGDLTPILLAVFGDGGSYEEGFALMPEGLTEPDNWFKEDDNWSSLPGSEVIADIFGEADLPIDMFWLLSIAALAVFGGFFIYGKTRHLFGMVIAVMMVMCFFAGVVMLDWWIVMCYAIVALGVLIKEQTYGY